MANLITLEEFKLYLGPETKLNTKNDDLMNACVASSSNLVRDLLGRDVDLQAYNENYDGNGLPYIALRQIPVALSPIPVVTENGVALVVGAGYSPNADVLVDPVRGWLNRNTGPTNVPGNFSESPGRWTISFQGINVVYTAGNSPVPEDLKLLTRYIASRLWHDSSRKSGSVARRSTGTNSVEFLQTIPDVYKEIVRTNRRVYFAR